MFEQVLSFLGEYVTKKRYAMAIGLVVGFLAGYPI